MTNNHKGHTTHTEHNLWCWILSWFGKRVRGSITLGCENPDCGCQHTIVIWQKPGENTWDVIQQQVQKEFERKRR